MKKIVIVLLMVSLILSCVACSGDNNSPTNGSEVGHNTEKTEPADQKDPAGQSDPELPGTVEINLPYIKFNVDAPDRNIHRAASGFRTVAETYAVIYDSYLDPSSQLLYEVELENIKLPEDIFVQMEKQIVANCATCLVSASTYTLNISKKENVTINGWDMCRVEGSIHLEEEYKLSYNDASFVAYGLLKDGYPAYFIAMDIPDGEGEHIDLGNLADRIARTFRDSE